MPTTPRPPIATERGRVRVDLFSEAAGTHLGAWQADPIKSSTSDRAARFLVAASGADEEIGRRVAAEVRARLGG